MKRLAATAWLLLPVFVGLGGGAWSAPAFAAGPAPREPLELSPVSTSVPVREVEGQPYLSANDLARLLGAARTWRADVRRLTLDARRHRIELILDNPFAVVDSSVVRLPYPARSVGGEMLVPAAFVDGLPRDPEIARLLYDPLRGAVVVIPPGGVVRASRLTADEGVTRLVFTADHPEEATLADRMRGHFRLRFNGYFAGGLPEIPAHGSLVLSIRPIGTASGSAFELVLAPEAAGFRLTRDPVARQVTLELARTAGEGFEDFALEATAFPPGTPTVVVDAGHGGADLGVVAGGLIEKHMTLELARLLRGELERRRIARVVLTRDDDRDVPGRQRAEAANRAHADLFLSLHFDGFPAARSRGVTAWCPPTRGSVPAVERGRSAAADRAPLTLRLWHEAALGHALRSHALAEAVRSAFVLRDLGPVRVREFVTEPLVGVDAPGVMLECATLTSPTDAERLRSPDALRAIAATLADAVAAWRRSE